MKRLLIVLSFLVFSSIAFAVGGVDGGGGRSIVCREKSGIITSAEMLDLFEGRVMYGLNIPESSDPKEVQIQNALNRIPKSTRFSIEAFTNIVQNNMKLVSGAQILPIDDSFEIIAPKGCAIEQAANYYNDKTILVDSDIWAHLTETGKAALILHEGLYKVNRLMGAKNSRLSRHAVANLFDPSTNWVDVQENIPQDKLKCISMTGGLYFSAFKDESNNWTLQFEVLGKNLVMSKKTLIVPNSKFDLNEAKKFPILQGSDLIGQSSTIAGTARSLFEDEDTILLSKKWEPVKDQQGQIIDGYQTYRYYLSWTSASFPNDFTSEDMLNCSIQTP